MKKIHFAGMALLCLFAKNSAAQNANKPDSSSIKNAGRFLYENMDKFILNDKVQENFCPDSVTLEFPEYEAKVMVSTRDAQRLKYSLFTLWQYELKQTLNEVTPAIADFTVPHKIDVELFGFGRPMDGRNRIKIEETSSRITNMITFRGKVLELIPPGWEVNIHWNEVIHIRVYARTFEQLKGLLEVDVQAIKAKALESFDTTRYRASLRGTLVYEKGEVAKADLYRANVFDYINLGIGGGISFFNSQIVPEINASATIMVRNRFRVVKHQIGLIPYFQMMTEEKADGSIKGYLNRGFSLSYNYNITNNSEKRVNFGFGFGLLDVNRPGYFSGKTMKVFLNTGFDRFTLSPEFYWTNGFKEFRPGFSIKYNF